MASITSASGVSSILGQYSGITSTEIEELLQGETVPKIRSQNRIEDIQKQKTAWSDVKSRLNNFLTKLKVLQSNEAFQTKKASSSDEKAATISGTADAAEGNYSLVVDQLATATKMVGSKLSKEQVDQVGLSGNLILKSAEVDEEGNRKVFTISVSSSDSLKEVATKVNKSSKESGISASVVDDRLVLSNTKTGGRNFSVEGTAVGVVGFDTAETIKGQEAKFRLDGIEIIRDSNTVSDVIEGVTFNLVQTTNDKPVKLSLTNDTEKMKASVKDFVSQYNSLMSLINDKLSVGNPSEEGNTTGALVGDSSLTRLQAELRNLITSPMTSGVRLKPGQLGISTTDREGTLGFDDELFTEQFEKDSEAVQNFFFQNEKVDGVTNESGYTVGLQSLADRYLSEKSDSKGIIATKFDTFESSIKDLNKQIQQVEIIIEQKRDRYVAMFTRLDQAMMEAESQMSWLVNQFSQTGN